MGDEAFSNVYEMFPYDTKSIISKPSEDNGVSLI